MRVFRLFSVAIILSILASCQAYKRDVMLRFDDKYDASMVEDAVYDVSRNYVFKPGDMIRLDVFTNEGERLIDPNFQLGDEGVRNNVQQQQMQFREKFTYLIFPDSTARFPKVNRVEIAGLTVVEAEEKLQELFDDYYKGAFVKVRPANRRVIVLGAIGNGQNGTGGQVIPIENEKTNILEVLALAGGIQQGAKVESIKLVRGELNDPKIFAIDLSTISGMRQGGMIVEPGDIIYLEPWRRPFRETIRDISPVLSLVTSVTTLVFVIQNANQN